MTEPATVLKLPAWAVRLRPITMDEACEVLRVSRRTLTSVLSYYEHDETRAHYEARGRKKLFYPEHIKALRRELEEWPPTSLSSKNGKGRPTGKPRSKFPAGTDPSESARAALKKIRQQRSRGTTQTDSNGSIVKALQP